MSVYNKYYDASTDTAVYQAVDEDGTYCVLITRGNRSEVTRCVSQSQQARVFSSNVRWYRGY